LEESNGQKTYTYYYKCSCGEKGDISYSVKKYEAGETIYGISFDANGGSGAPDSVDVKAGASLTIPTVEPTRTGYVFCGWSTNKTASSPSYQKNDKIIITDSFTLFAVWRKSEYTVSFNANGGTGKMTSMNCKGDTKYTLSACGFTRSGYSFMGWALSSSGKVVYQDKETICNLASDGITKTLYAKWKAVSSGEEPSENLLIDTTLISTDVSVQISGNTLTVTYSKPCKVGYWDETAKKYVAVPAKNVGTNSYSFELPEGTIKAAVVMTGDCTGDGKIALLDAVKTLAFYQKRVTPTDELFFAADVDNNGKIALLDYVKVLRVYQGYITFSW